MPERPSGQHPARPGGPRGGPRRRSPVTASRSVRPSARRSGGNGTGAATRTSAPRPRRRVTGRTVVLGVVLLALALSFVFPLRVYLAQQADISQLRADQREQRARIDGLAAEAALWADEDYIRIQARKRLYYGEPGEMLLLPVWEDEQPPPDPGLAPDERPVSPEPWWDSLWTSIRAADGSTSSPGEGAD